MNEMVLLNGSTNFYFNPSLCRIKKKKKYKRGTDNYCKTVSFIHTRYTYWKFSNAERVVS